MILVNKIGSLLLFPLAPLLFAEVRLEPESLMSRNLSLYHILRRSTLCSQLGYFFLCQEFLLNGIGVIDEFVCFNNVV